MTLRVGDFKEDPKTFEDHVNVDFLIELICYHQAEDT